MKRRSFTGALGAAVWLALGLAGTPLQAADTQVRTLTWAQLVPAGWSLTQSFGDAELAKLQDNDPRANEILVRMREAADQAPTNPALAGQLIRIAGFVVPLEEMRGEIREFLLVPYFGACIHSPPPPANQIIHVKNARQSTGLRSMDIVWVTGKLQIDRADTMMGVSGYHVSADSVAPYAGAAPK